MLLAEKEEEISIFRVEMNRLESKMETLAARRRAVRQIAKSYHALLSPFRRFPPELLSEIFLHCLPDALYPTPAYNAPLILCWVSQKWRQIALATPGLWTSPSTMVSLLKRPTSNPRCLPDLWLTRSQALPLDVRIYIDQGRSASKSVWDAYVSHVSRWKHLRLKYKSFQRPVLRCSKQWCLDWDLGKNQISTKGCNSCVLLIVYANSHGLGPLTSSSRCRLRTSHP